MEVRRDAAEMRDREEREEMMVGMRCEGWRREAMRCLCVSCTVDDSLVLLLWFRGIRCDESTDDLYRICCFSIVRVLWRCWLCHDEMVVLLML